MALTDVLEKKRKRQKEQEGISEDVIMKDLPRFQELISYWRWYPDRFVDWLVSLDDAHSFEFFFYQRIYLRCVMRHKYTYCVFPRGYSKSFLAVLSLMIKAVLYPGARLFVASGGKKYATLPSDGQ